MREMGKCILDYYQAGSGKGYYKDTKDEYTQN